MISNIEIKEVATKKLDNVMRQLPRIVEDALNMAAMEIKAKMVDEAPEATGQLKSSIDIFPSTFERIIKPTAEYAFYKETRNNVSQATPPISRIQEWADAVGASGKGVAFLIARKIAQTGYTAKPFVRNTYNWAKGQVAKWFGSVPMKVKMTYETG